MELGLAGPGGGSSMLNKLFDASLDLTNKYAAQRLGISDSTALVPSTYSAPAKSAPGGMDTNTMLLLAAAAVAFILFVK